MGAHCIVCSPKELYAVLPCILRKSARLTHLDKCQNEGVRTCVNAALNNTASSLNGTQTRQADALDDTHSPTTL